MGCGLPVCLWVVVGCFFLFSLGKGLNLRLVCNLRQARRSDDPALIDELELQGTEMPLLSKTVRFVLAGTGTTVQSPPVIAEIVRLSNKPRPRVLYLGSASSESKEVYQSHVQGFVDASCPLQWLKLAPNRKDLPSASEIRAQINRADVILCSGGSALVAVARWRELNIVPLFQQAMVRGTIIAGGSAGKVAMRSFA